MTIHRVHKTKNYTVMSNYHLQDKSLSLKAKGLLSIILSLSDEWKHSAKGYATLSRDGISAVNSAIKELEEAGYMMRARHKPTKGNNRIHCDYDIFETPQACAEWERGVMLDEMNEHLVLIEDGEDDVKERKSVLGSDAPKDRFPCQENHALLNTKNKSTESPLQGLEEDESTDVQSPLLTGTCKEPLLNSKREEEARERKVPQKRFVPPTPEEVDAYIAEKGYYGFDGETFCDFYASKGWKVGNQRMVDWRRACATWFRRAKADGRKPKHDYGEWYF